MKYSNTLAVTIFRSSFGLVWLIDGLMKFIFMAPSDVTDLVTGASQGQPNWLQPWYNFWISSVSSAPAAYLYGIGALELLLGFVLVAGFLRKTSYIAGLSLSLMIWSIDEGYGGPYGPGSTDIGAAIMYAFIFVAIMIMEAGATYNHYSIDAIVEAKWKGWRQLSELHGETP